MRGCKYDQNLVVSLNHSISVLLLLLPLFLACLSCSISFISPALSISLFQFLLISPYSTSSFAVDPQSLSAESQRREAQELA